MTNYQSIRQAITSLKEFVVLWVIRLKRLHGMPPVRQFWHWNPNISSLCRGPEVVPAICGLVVHSDHCVFD